MRKDVQSSKVGAAANHEIGSTRDAVLEGDDVG